MRMLLKHSLCLCFFYTFHLSFLTLKQICVIINKSAKILVNKCKSRVFYHTWRVFYSYANVTNVRECAWTNGTYASCDVYITIYVCIYAHIAGYHYLWCLHFFSTSLCFCPQAPQDALPYTWLLKWKTKGLRNHLENVRLDKYLKCKIPYKRVQHITIIVHTHSFYRTYVHDLYTLLLSNRCDFNVICTLILCPCRT